MSVAWLHSELRACLRYIVRPAFKKKRGGGGGAVGAVESDLKVIRNEHEEVVMSMDSVPTYTFCFSDHAFVLTIRHSFLPARLGCGQLCPLLTHEETGSEVTQ